MFLQITGWFFCTNTKNDFVEVMFGVYELVKFKIPVLAKVKA